VKDGRTTIATVQHVVGMADTVAARNARHGTRTVREMEGGEQEKVACPLFIPQTSDALAAGDESRVCGSIGEPGWS
jgi:hypothetical protein